MIIFLAGQVKVESKKVVEIQSKKKEKEDNSKSVYLIIVEDINDIEKFPDEYYYKYKKHKQKRYSNKKGKKLSKSPIFLQRKPKFS